MKRQLIMCTVVGLLLTAGPAVAGTTTPDAASYTQGSVGLPAPDYDWWYGCSPTSAGMMMGYYDREGYGGLLYDNLVPGGTAEPETHVGPPTGWSALANNAIASTGHVADYYGDNGTGDPLGSGRTLPDDWNCLADFMGTSQGSRSDGGTSFTYWVNGNPYYESSSSLGEGMYGVGQYVEYAGYDAAVLYNQLIPGVADDLWGYTPNTNGFTWDDYVAEIDAGRTVMIQVEGHSMMGYGYDAQTGEVLLHDTWSLGEHRMLWGDSYSGLLHYGVMVLEIMGGDTPGGVVPVPSALVLAGIGGCLVRRYRRYRVL